jgi:hypothetical protein
MSPNVPETPPDPDPGKDRARRDQAVLLLASGASVSHAATAAGVDRRTIARWQRHESFRRRVAEARAEMFARSVGLMAAAQAKAVARLIALIDSRNEMVALSASKTMVETGHRLHGESALAELKDRLDHVEAHQAVGGCQP